MWKLNKVVPYHKKEPGVVPKMYNSIVDLDGLLGENLYRIKLENLPEPSKGPNPDLRSGDGHRELNRFVVFRPKWRDWSRCARACTGPRATSRTWTASGCRRTWSPCRWIRSCCRRSERRRRRRCRWWRPKTSTDVGLSTPKMIFSTTVTRFLNSGDSCFVASCCCCRATTSTGCRRRRWRRCCCRRRAWSWRVVRKISTFAGCFGSVHAAGRSFEGAPRLRGLTSFSFLGGWGVQFRQSATLPPFLSLLFIIFWLCAVVGETASIINEGLSLARGPWLPLSLALTFFLLSLSLSLSLSLFLSRSHSPLHYVSFFSIFHSLLSVNLSSIPLFSLHFLPNFVDKEFSPSMAFVISEKIGAESHQK